MKFLLHTIRWGVFLLVLSVASPAQAINQLTVTVGHVRTARATAQDGRVLVRLRATDLAIRVQAASVHIRRPGIPTLRKVTFECARVHLGTRLTCGGGRFAALSAPLGLLRGTFSARFNSRTGAIHVRAGQMTVAGGRVRLLAAVHSGQWQMSANASRIALAKAAALLRPWVHLPADDTLSGPLKLRLSAGNHPALQLRFTASTPALNFSNGPGTVVSQNLAASLHGTLAKRPDGVVADVTLRGTHGQALAGPVYLDLGAHPLTLHVNAVRRDASTVEISRLQLREPGVIDAHAQARLTLGAHPGIDSAHVRLTRLTFPGAYASFLQMRLASTTLGSLKSSGWLNGSLTLAGGIAHIDATLHGLDFKDKAVHLRVQDAEGALHWTSAAGVSVAPSELSWRKVGLYGLTGGAVHLRFLAWARNFALLGGNVRLPVFNGAIVIHTLVGRDLGSPRAKVDFDADLTPISMPLLSKAFGWPVMNGRLFGHIPLVQYRDHVLQFQGDLVAHVFDGVITGSHIRLDNPLGQWPQMHADVKARGLDLGMVTRTFAFGSMTGRIDADITGLKLFDWSPVAFDARIYTMPGDRSAHRISQNAVTRIAAFGGGGGAVAAALESGVLRFFKTFHYRRLAIGCRLRNEVCHMSGVAPADNGGYYLVQGSWIPRLDIIGNVRRVNWPRLLGQIKQGLSSGGVKVN